MVAGCSDISASGDGLFEKVKEGEMKFRKGALDGALETWIEALRCAHMRVSGGDATYAVCSCGFYLAYSIAQLCLLRGEKRRAEAFLRNGSYYVDYSGEVCVPQAHLQKFLLLLDRCK